MRCGAISGLTMSSAKKSTERLIKKYPNRRLYDTQTSSYITLTDVKQLVLDADDFTVVDAKTNEDLTRSILLQIMNVQGPMMQGMMNNYIDQSKNLFVQMQEQMQTQSKSIFGTFPFPPTDKK